MKYSSTDLIALVEEFRSLPAETGWLEFKTNMADPVKIARYISSLANMAAYAGRSYGYLIWGVNDVTHEIEGTSFNKDAVKAEKNQPLELWLRLVVKPQISYEFFEFEIDGKRLVLLEVESAYRQPVTVSGGGWARIGNALVELNKDPKIAAAIYRTVERDWSAEIVPSATVGDLDATALAKAREMYADKHKDDIFASEIPTWDDITFLNKAKLAIDGRLTRACLVLLAKPEKEHLLSPSVIRVTWHLKDTQENSIDYKHFDVPLILAVDQVLAKIRSLTLREIPDGTLFPVEINQYDRWVLREALHNCIAHQDYTKRTTIVVTEYPDRVQFANSGVFYPGTVEKVLYDTGRPRQYPNKQLAEAMVELKMIDTLGSGIRRMFMKQRERFMPLPDYRLDDEVVVVNIPGRILDARYCGMLIRNAELTLQEIVLLDRVQKHVKLEDDAIALLRKHGLIEGRKTNPTISARVAQMTGGKADYIKTKSVDDEFLKKLIVNFLKQWGKASRKDIEDVLKGKLQEGLSADEVSHRITYLLTGLRRAHVINNRGSRTKPEWILCADSGVQKEVKKVQKERAGKADKNRS